MLDTALVYADYGWFVLPVTPNTKVPAFGLSYEQATRDHAQITAWWSELPNAGIAVNLVASGLVAIDADTYKPDCEWDPDLYPTPPTFTQRTGRGGLHLVYTAPHGTDYPGTLCRGVDIKRNGYILLAPTPEYTVTDNTAPAPAPSWIPLRDHTSDPKRELAFDTTQDVQSCLDAIPNDHTEWETWSKLAGAIHNAGGTFEQFDAWSRQCPEYDERETRTKWQQVQRSPYRDIGAGTLVELARRYNPFFQRPSRALSAFEGSPSTTIIEPNGQTILPPCNQPQAKQGGYMLAQDQTAHFAGCVYVADRHAVLMPNRELRKPEAFRVARGGWDFQMMPDGSKPTKNAFECFTESRMIEFPKADTTCFDPLLSFGDITERDGLRMVNTYQPAFIQTSDADVGPFHDLMQRLFPNEHDRAIMYAYLAALIQHPGVKFRWCPVVQGVEGNAKGALPLIAEYLVSPRYTHKPSSKELGDSGAKFTGWLDEKLLVVIDEVYVGDRRDLLDALKPMITDDRIEVQAKGVNQRMVQNFANFLMTTNHRDAIQKTMNDRRYAIFYTAQQTYDDLLAWGMGDSYFNTFYPWLKQGGGFQAIAGYLQRHTIPDNLNPATRCHRAPVTSSTQDAITESRGFAEQHIIEAIEQQRTGFRGGWLSSVMVSHLLKEIGRNIAPKKRGAIMASLGYTPHPALRNGGQAPQALFSEDNKRPVLYVQKNTPDAAITDSAEAFGAYCNAQGYDVG